MESLWMVARRVCLGVLFMVGVAAIDIAFIVAAFVLHFGTMLGGLVVLVLVSYLVGRILEWQGA